MHDLKLILHLISTILKNQHRNNNFISKFEQILQLFGEDILSSTTKQSIYETNYFLEKQNVDLIE